MMLMDQDFDFGRDGMRKLDHASITRQP